VVILVGLCFQHRLVIKLATGRLLLALLVHIGAAARVAAELVAKRQATAGSLWPRGRLAGACGVVPVLEEFSEQRGGVVDLDGGEQLLLLLGGEFAEQAVGGVGGLTEYSIAAALVEGV